MSTSKPSPHHHQHSPHHRRQQRLRVGLVPSQKPLLRQTVSGKLTKGNTTTLSLGRRYRQHVRNWLTLSTNAPKIPSCQSSLTSFSFSPLMVALKARSKRLTRAQLFVSPTRCATFVCPPLLAPAGRSNCTSSSTRQMMRRKSAPAQILQRVKTCS